MDGERLLIVTASNPRDSDFLDGTKTAGFLGGWRIKKWVEQTTEHEAMCVNTDVEDPTSERVREFDPTHVGVSSFWMTRKFDARKGKELADLYDATLTYGGIGPTFGQRFYIEEGGADYVVEKEGPKSMVEILDGRATEPVLKATPERRLTEPEWRWITMAMDYEKMPWEEIWEYNRKHFGISPAIRLITVNFCPKGCDFCTSTNFFQKLKMLDADELAELIERCSDILPGDPGSDKSPDSPYGKRTGTTKNSYERTGEIILQSDDELIGKAKERFKELHERGWESPRPLSIQTNVEELDDEMLTVLKEVGVDQLCMGIENFDERLLKEFNKPVTRWSDTPGSENYDTIINAMQHGFDVYANLLLTHPEVDEEVNEEAKRRTLAIAESLDDKAEEYGVKWDYGANQRAIPMPGADLWEKTGKENLSVEGD